MLGILENDSRLSDLRSQFDKRLDAMDRRIDDLRSHFDQRLDDMRDTWRAELPALAVLLGVLINNSRLTDLRSEMRSTIADLLVSCR